MPALRGKSFSEAFRLVYRNGVDFSWDANCYYCRPNSYSEDYYHPCIDNNDFGGTDSHCKPAGGVTLGSSRVMFASLWLSGNHWGHWNNASERARNNVVHELGHVFDNLFENAPSNTLSATWTKKIGLECYYQENFPHVNPKVTGNYGFASSSDIRTWQMHPSGEAKEEFADMFLGWVFNRWETNAYGPTPDGSTRSQWMDKYMNIWLNNYMARSGG